MIQLIVAWLFRVARLIYGLRFAYWKFALLVLMQQGSASTRV